jgi:hypothetical protein
MLILIAVLLWINTGITLDVAVSKAVQIPPSKKTIYMAALLGPTILFEIWKLP